MRYHHIGLGDQPVKKYLVFGIRATTLLSNERILQ